MDCKDPAEKYVSAEYKSDLCISHMLARHTFTLRCPLGVHLTGMIALQLDNRRATEGHNNESEVNIPKSYFGYTVDIHNCKLRNVQTNRHGPKINGV